MCPAKVPPRRSEFSQLATLFFVHGMALGMWFVPLGTILTAHGLGDIKPYVYASSALAALVSPLIFGSLADQRVPPARLLRWLCVAAAAVLMLTCQAIAQGWGKWWVLGLCQLHWLCFSPTWSLTNTIVLARLENSTREFGPLRACGTLGWVAGCWVVSYVLQADESTVAGYGAMVAWLAVAGYTYFLPVVLPGSPKEKRTWKDRLGLEALQLLRHRNHRVVFIGAALFNIPMAAFYPYTPPHLQDLGFTHTSAVTTLGQVTEVISMFSLAWLLSKCRMKTVFLAGIAFGAVRYALCMLNNDYAIPAILVGITMHGFAYTLFFITAQIYIEQQVPAAFRARAQALFTFMVGGIGNLLGFLGTGWWNHAASSPAGKTNWTLFWGGLVLAVLGVFVFFATRYRGEETAEPPGERVKG